MARSLEKNNAHFQRALAKLPLGVSSNFRYWGDDQTLYVKTRQRAADLGPRRQRVRRLPARLRARDPGSWASRGRRRGAGVARRSARSSRCQTEREASGRGADLRDGGGRGAGPLLQLGHRGRDGGAAHRPRRHRPRRLRDLRGQLPRPVRRGDVAGERGGAWTTPTASRSCCRLGPGCRGSPGSCCCHVPYNDAESPRGRAEARGQQARGRADRADAGQLLRDSRRLPSSSRPCASCAHATAC